MSRLPAPFDLAGLVRRFLDAGAMAGAGRCGPPTPSRWLQYHGVSDGHHRGCYALFQGRDVLGLAATPLSGHGWAAGVMFNRAAGVCSPAAAR